MKGGGGRGGRGRGDGEERGSYLILVNENSQCLTLPTGSHTHSRK